MQRWKEVFCSHASATYLNFPIVLGNVFTNIKLDNDAFADFNLDHLSARFDYVNATSASNCVWALVKYSRDGYVIQSG